MDKKNTWNGIKKVIWYAGCSGIVQSVEQRTVNPYVTGSSPVARAKDFPQDFHSLRDFLLFVDQPTFMQNESNIAPLCPENKTKSERFVTVAVFDRVVIIGQINDADILPKILDRALIQFRADFKRYFSHSKHNL